MWHAQCFRCILFLPDFHGYDTAARGARFLRGFRKYLILAQTDQVYLILAFTLFYQAAT